MNKIILMLALVAISACSKNEKGSSSVNPELSDIKDEIVFEALSVRTISVDGQNTVPASTLDFATLQPKQSGTQDLIITNGLSTELVFGASDIDASNISPFVMTESCSNKTLARNRSCKLTFSVLNNPNPVETVLTKSLTIKGSVIQLTATLAADTTPVNAPVEGISVSPSLLDFGLMKDGEIKELSIAVTNRGTTTQTIAAPVISNPKLSISSNTCSSLARNRSCSIKIRYSASTDESIVEQSFTSIANNDITHSVLVQSPTVSEPQVLTINPTIASSSFNLNDPQIQNATMTFTNTGTIELPSPVQAIAQPSTGVTINSVSCTGGLSRGRTCSVSYSLNSALLSGGASQVQLKLQSGTLASNIHTINLNVTKLATPCTVADAQANGWNTDNHLAISGIKTGSDVSQCAVSSCSSNYAISGQACEPIACQVSDVPFSTAVTGFLAAVCLPTACQENYSINGSSCSPTLCTEADIANSAMVSGDKVNGCSLVACANEYTQNGNVCETTPCDINNASGNGVLSILEATAVTGIINDDSCRITSCNPYYEVDMTGVQCQAKQCAQLTSTELTNAGYDLTNATVSGAYPNCMVSCNSDYQQLNPIDGKSCVDKAPTGTIVFANTTTNSTSNNQLNISATNAQEIVIHNDVMCSTPVTTIPLPPGLSSTTVETSTTVSIAGTAGINTVYAKLNNGSSSSDCLSASITYEALVDLTTNIVGPGKVSINPLGLECVKNNGSCTNTVPESSSLDLIAVPSYGYYFQEWGEDCAGELTDSCYLFMNNNKIVQATFIEKFNKVKGLSGNVYSAIITDNGKILVGGTFVSYNGTTNNRIVRLNSDWSIDTSFVSGSGFNNDVWAITKQSNGQVIVLGAFTSYNGASVNRIARLNADGTLDTSFNNAGSGFNGTIFTATELPDGKILAGGTFTSYNGITTGGIARINTDGTLDTSFNPGTGANNTVWAIASFSDGKIMIGGTFTTYSGTSINRIARLNADGTLDTSFNPGTGPNDAVYSIVIQDSGKVVIVGNFVTYNGPAPAINRIARLNSDGSIDTSFNDLLPAFNNNVYWMRAQADGKLLVGGPFTAYNGVTSNRIIRLNVNGSIDSTFNVGTGFDDAVEFILAQNDGKILIGGRFSSYNQNSVSKVARLNSDGSLESGLLGGGSGFNGLVERSVIQSDGKIVVGGDFGSYNGTARPRIARLNSNGTLDSTFVVGTGFNALVEDIAIQSDGKIIVGGNFTSYNGTAINRIARLNSNGTLDSTFVVGTGFDYAVHSLKIQSDGKIVVGGWFDNYNGTARRAIARLNSTGTLDTTLNPGTGISSSSNRIYDLEIQPNGKFIVSGDFTGYNGTTRNRIARINADGTLDLSFDPGTGFNSTVFDVAIQSDGKIISVGTYTSYSGTTINRITRINTDGSRDQSFNSGTGFASAIKGVTIDSSGKIIVGGDFTSYNGFGADRIIRLNSDGSESN